MKRFLNRWIFEPLNERLEFFLLIFLSHFPDLLPYYFLSFSLLFLLLPLCASMQGLHPDASVADTGGSTSNLELDSVNSFDTSEHMFLMTRKSQRLSLESLFMVSYFFLKINYLVIVVSGFVVYNFCNL